MCTDKCHITLVMNCESRSFCFPTRVAVPNVLNLFCLLTLIMRSKFECHINSRLMVYPYKYDVIDPILN